MERTTGLKVVTALFALGSILFVLAAIILMVFGSAILSTARDSAVGPLFAVFGGIISIFFLVTAIIDGVIAWGLWNMRPWARIAASVLAGLSLLSIPFGTIIGAIELYILWFDEKTKALFAT